MTLIAVGDIFVALSVGGSIVLDGPQGWKLQLGESVSITGVTGLLVLLLFFTLPFVASAMWAISRGRSGAIGPPLTDETQEECRDSGEKTKSTNGFRYSQGRV